MCYIHVFSELSFFLFRKIFFFVSENVLEKNHDFHSEHEFPGNIEKHVETDITIENLRFDQSDIGNNFMLVTRLLWRQSEMVTTELVTLVFFGTLVPPSPT